MKCLILAGGGGTRLWPLSTKEQPKQFQDLFKPGVSLLKMTFDRLAHLTTTNDIYVSTSEEYATLTLVHCPISKTQLILEPAQRNNAAAIGLSLIKLSHALNGADDTCSLFPADHLMGNEQVFSEVFRFSEKVMRDHPDHLLTWGITPTYAETGYGYIEKSPYRLISAGSLDAYLVGSFREKPDLITAQNYLAGDRYYWNAGIFFFQLNTMLAWYETYLPAIYEGLLKIKAVLGTPQEEKVIREIYPTLPATSIDYGIIEKIDRRIVVPVRDLQWDDVGNYSSLYNLSNKDSQGNVVRGKPILIEAENNYVSQIKKPVVLVGVRDLIVVETEKAILVTDLAHSQSIKKVVEYLKRNGPTELL